MTKKRSPPSASSSSTTSTSSSSASGSSSSTSRSLPSSSSSGTSRSSSFDNRPRSPSTSSSSLRSRSSGRKRNSRRDQQHRNVKSKRESNEGRHRRRSWSPRGSPPDHDHRRYGRRGHVSGDRRWGGERKRSPDEHDRYRGRPRRQHSDELEGRGREVRRSSRDRYPRSRDDRRYNGERGRGDRSGRDDRIHDGGRRIPARGHDRGHQNDREHDRKRDVRFKEKDTGWVDHGKGRHEGGNGKNVDHGGKRRPREESLRVERDDHELKRRRTEEEAHRGRSGASKAVADTADVLDRDNTGGESSKGRDTRGPKEDTRHEVKADPDVKKEDALETSRWGAKPSRKQQEPSKPAEDVGPNFGLSGKLAEESRKVKGVVMKFTEPPEARKPDLRWRLYIFKGGEVVGEPIPIHRQSYYLFGRDRAVTDIPTDHPSCSKQHSVLQFRCVEVETAEGLMTEAIKPYLMDLESVNGTFINRERVEPHRYYELMEQDTVRFGLSSREYVLLHEGSVG